MRAAIVAALIAGAWVAFCALTVVPSHGHEWFLNKKTASGQSCCNGVDCREIEDADWWQDGNAYSVRWSDGLVYYIPVDAAQPSESKDGKAAACIYNGRLRCFFVPLSY